MEGELSVSKNSNSLLVQGNEFTIGFDQKSGMLNSLVYHGEEMLVTEKMKPSYYRAPTDNDIKGGSWAHLEKIQSIGKNVRIVSQSSQKVIIASEVVSTDSRGGKLVQKFTWTIFANGVIDVDADFSKKSLEEILPIVGVLMRLAKRFENIQWYGRGPQENYRDRKFGVALGLYQTTVTAMNENYVRPQETGNRDDVRWMSLTDDEGKGLLIKATNPMSMKALHYTPMDLHQANHTVELVERNETVLSIDAAHQGLGNKSCGPAPLTNYLLSNKKLNYSFSIRPWSDQQGERSVYARKQFTVK